MLRDERLMLMIAVLYAANPLCTNVLFALDNALKIELIVRDHIAEENMKGQLTQNENNKDISRKGRHKNQWDRR
jgi:hypothetical protein